MRIEVTAEPLEAVDADLHVTGLAQGEELDGAYRELPGAGDARGGFRKHTLLRPDADRRLLVVGLGKRDELDPERLRICAAVAVAQAARYEATTIAWSLPESGGAGVTPATLAAGLVEGTILASFRFDRFKSRDPDDPPPPALERLVISAPGSAGDLDERGHPRARGGRGGEPRPGAPGTARERRHPDVSGRPRPGDRGRPRLGRGRGAGPRRRWRSAAWAA